MPKLVALLRVKDGILFLGDWLERMSSLVDEIVVVDNGSTDGTLEILQQHHKVVSIIRTTGYDEGRDKILAYKLARERKPDWVIWLDVDEIFEERLTRTHLDRLMASKFFSRYFFRRLQMVDREHFNATPYWIRYSCWPDRIMWREQPTGYFEDLQFNNGLIRGIRGLSFPTHFRIKHLGSVAKQLLESKIQLYRSLDPSLEVMYQRIQHLNPIKWRWYEYSESPVWVTAQNALMDICFAIVFFLAVISRIAKSLSKILVGVAKSFSVERSLKKD